MRSATYLGRTSLNNNPFVTKLMRVRNRFILFSTVAWLSVRQRHPFAILLLQRNASIAAPRYLLSLLPIVLVDDTMTEMVLELSLCS